MRERMRTLRGQYAQLKGHAKKYSRDFSITLEEYEQLRTLPCVFCGWPLPETGGGLDRIDSEKGYTTGNVVPCCWHCNLTKNSYFTFEEMKVIGAAIARVKAQRMAEHGTLDDSAGKRFGRKGRPKKYADKSHE